MLAGRAVNVLLTGAQMRNLCTKEIDDEGEGP